MIKDMKKGPGVLVSQGTSATFKDGSVVPLTQVGGGITIPASQSISGKIEIVFDKNNLVPYKAADNSTVTETVAGLLLHQYGHGSLMQKGDASQDSPGPAAEKGVRELTNPIREEMGQKAEAEPER